MKTPNVKPLDRTTLPDRSLIDLWKYHARLYREVMQPVRLEIEARWVADKRAQGIAPWTDPAYCADWLAYLDMLTKCPSYYSGRGDHDHQLWLAWHAGRTQTAAKSPVRFLIPKESLPNVAQASESADSKVIHHEGRRTQAKDHTDRRWSLDFNPCHYE